ncbi:hypothetical protein VKT23_004630 [Stygiomarasmius scandens]|uniref:Uncharacterized protein n=1 Tax=Marasmiellus scandens TaxID=2682957 RepID=A0ABR1JUN9_9AGAR
MLAEWRTAEIKFYERNVVFVDKEGVSLLWFLPDLVANDIKHKVFQKTPLVQKKMVKCIAAANNPELDISTKPKGWRVSQLQFLEKKHKPIVFPGICNFSFGWRPAGHEWTNAEVASSTSLREPLDMVRQTEEWLHQISQLQIIVSLVLSFIHPDLYTAGQRTLDKCCQENSPATSHWAKKWNSVFTALTVISSRLTVPHIDSKGAVNYFDALIGIGTATKPRLILRELNASFLYKAGTGVFFSGRGWTHEVPDWGNGEQLCYASYMRPEMMEYGGGKLDSFGLKLPLP